MAKKAHLYYGISGVPTIIYICLQMGRGSYIWDFRSWGNSAVFVWDFLLVVCFFWNDPDNKSLEWKKGAV
uniref:Uncharacterized protein n=1 Tax=Acrobeloides nanus TaxID=290746 RepID=A0A914C924_9BILA